MVVDRSDRPCLLCGKVFRGRTFLCRDCADRFRDGPVPVDVRRHFYAEIDRVYPDWSNTYGQYNPPVGLLSHVQALPRSSRVLEIGAGGGFTLESLRRMGFSKLFGSDITSTTLQEMRRRLGQIDLIATDAELLPFQNRSLDVLISSDVIEHLADLARHLEEVARVLDIGGSYLIKTPNRLMAAQYYRLRGLYDAYFWHPSMCSPLEIRAMLERNGFKVSFLSAPRLTDAQLRKIPIKRLRSIASRVPLSRLPLRLRPHLEIVATLRTSA